MDVKKIILKNPGRCSETMVLIRWKDLRREICKETAAEVILKARGSVVGNHAPFPRAICIKTTLHFLEYQGINHVLWSCGHGSKTLSKSRRQISMGLGEERFIVDKQAKE